jgi:hypothetical protein
MTSPVVLTEFPRPGGRLVLQRHGDGAVATYELRVVLDDGRSKGVQLYVRELTRVIEVLSTERNCAIGHPKHGVKK